MAIEGIVTPAPYPARMAAGTRNNGPAVELGPLEAGGIAPSVFAMAERGAALRPATARELRGTVEIRFTQRFAPVRLTFEGKRIVVGDAPPGRSPQPPDLVIRGSLPDIVQLVSVPLMGGLPRPTGPRGRAALASVTSGRVQIEGSRKLARNLLKLLEI